jgi:HK97 family phage major capsid protein
LLNQATNGITVLSGVNSVTYTDATPTAGELYAKFADAIQQVWTNRFAAPDLIVMHPRRWAFFLGAVDSQNRPLVLPDPDAANNLFNSLATGTTSRPQGLVGSLMGLPVVIDPNISITLGAGTNEDIIVVTRRDDQLLFEVGAPTVAVETGVLSANLQVRIYAYGYFAFTFARYAKATSRIAGTGLATPTF